MKQNVVYEEVVRFEASRATQDFFLKETLCVELKNLNFILTTLGSLRFELRLWSGMYKGRGEVNR